jgi:hypothetical protein
LSCIAKRVIRKNNPKTMKNRKKKKKATYRPAPMFLRGKAAHGQAEKKDL